jgi:DNA-binding MarR family transcriptional regulator
MKDSQVAKMRAFNRFYTAHLGVLNRKYLNGEFSLPEIRVLYAIYTTEGIMAEGVAAGGITANDIVLLLHIDKSYLSKILIRFGRMKFLTKKISTDDGRAYHLHLTAAGRKKVELYDRLSNEFVRQMLVQLSEKDCEELVDCMQRITGILERVRM